MKRMLLGYRHSLTETAEESLFVFVLNVTTWTDFFLFYGSLKMASVMTTVYYLENHRGSTKKIKLTNLENLSYLKPICLTLYPLPTDRRTEYKPGDW